MEQRRFIFQPYTGPSSRDTCPQCGHKRSFTRFLDTQTGELLPDHVGRCDRKDKCGYWYSPATYFSDSGERPLSGGGMSLPPVEVKSGYRMTRADVLATKGHWDEGNLIRYLLKHIPEDALKRVMREYAVGTWVDSAPMALMRATVFWKVGTDLSIRTGKVIQYDPATGRRRKEPGMQNWVHKIKTGKGAADLGVEDCLFGLHRLGSWPEEKPIAIVEAEKTALIASALQPDLLWLATGGLAEFKLSKLMPLAGRRVIAFPDLGAGFQEWQVKAGELSHLFKRIEVSPLLERLATDQEQAEGLDLADFLLRPRPTTATLIDPIKGTRPSVMTLSGAQVLLERSSPTTTLPSMILTEAEQIMKRWTTTNPTLAQLVDLLDLDISRAVVTKSINSQMIDATLDEPKAERFGPDGEAYRFPPGSILASFDRSVQALDNLDAEQQALQWEKVKARFAGFRLKAFGADGEKPLVAIPIPAERVVSLIEGPVLDPQASA